MATADLGVHAGAWLLALLLCLALAAPLRRYTGAGPWAPRAAIAHAIC